MFLTTVVVAGVLIGSADAFILRNEKKFLKAFLIMLGDAFCANAISMFVSDAALKNNWAGNIDSGWLYLIIVSVVGFVWLFVSAMAEGKVFYTKNTEKQKKFPFAGIASVFMFVLGMAAFTGTIWGKETFGELSPDQMLISMFTPKDGTSSDIMDSLWTGPVFRTVAATAFFVMFVFSSRMVNIRKKDKELCVFSLVVRKITSLVLSAVILIGGFAYGIAEFELFKLLRMYVIESEFIEENFADPREVKLEVPEEKRNLIHIYIESMENSYLSEDMGGYLEENLMKPLTDLAKDGVSFSHLEKGFGGPVATTGCVWSVASMVNMNTGLPMKVPTAQNAYGEEDNFLPGAVTIGDILSALGYEQSLMFGATARFGGLNYFYKSHGDFNILDHDAAKEKGWIPEDYSVWWGYEDDKLFDFAKTELIRLYETGKPFNFVMETADTHFPDGYVGKNTPTPRDNQYANVIAYSASEIAKFVKWIQKQPFYENTTIVIIGDHLSMDGAFFEDFDKDYLRTTFNLILNPAPGLLDIPEERTQNRWWYNGDMFPTILASIGIRIEGDRLGLGTNLFSDTPTLFEEHGGEKGWEKINKIFEMKSTFYNENILVGENKPFDCRNVTFYKNDA